MTIARLFQRRGACIIKEVRRSNYLLLLPLRLLCHYDCHYGYNARSRERGDADGFKSRA